MKNKKLFFGIYIILLFILFISLTILAILGKKERVGYLSEFKINVDNTLELNYITSEDIKELFGSKFDYDSITNYLLTNESITIYSYDFRIKYYDKIFRNSDIYGVYPNLNNLPEYVKLANMDDNRGTPFGNLASIKILDIEKIDNINYVLKLKNKLILIYIMLLIILFIFICFIYRNNIYKFIINATKNKRLIIKICFIIIALIIISIVVLAFLGKKYREGYLSDFNLNIDNTLQINNLDINETKKLFTIDAKLNEVAITNYIFTNSSITNYSYNFRIKYYSKIFRNSDIYGVYPDLDNLPEYVQSARMNFKLGGPFGILISDKELEYNDKIDIKYYLLINYNIYYYFASIFAIIMIFIGFYLLNKYLIYKKNLIYEEYSFLNKIEIVGLILFIFKIWLFYPGHYGYYDTIYSSMLGVIGSNSGNHHPVLTELNIGLIDKLGLSMGVFFVINTFLIYISLFLIILSLYIKYKNKMVILLYLVTFIAQIFFNSIVYLKDYLATLYTIFSFSIVFFIVVSDIKNIKIRNILKSISLISLIIGMLHRHNFIVTVYPIMLWFTYDYLKTKNINNIKKYIFKFVSIMFMNAIILMGIFYIFPRLFVRKSVTNQINNVFYIQMVGTLIEAKDDGSSIPNDLYNGKTFDDIVKDYKELEKVNKTHLYLMLWSQSGNLKYDTKKQFITLLNIIKKYPISYIKFMYDFNKTRCTMRYYGYYSPIFDDTAYEGPFSNPVIYNKITREEWYDTRFYQLNRGANYSKLQSNTYNFLVNTLPDINISVFTIISILLFFITGLLWILKRKYRNDLLLLSFSLAFSAFATIVLLFIFSNVIDYRFIYPIIPISILALISFIAFLISDIKSNPIVTERQIPKYEYKEYFSKRNEYCLLIPTWNEGERIQIELKRLKDSDIPRKIDIFLLDAGSTDGSINDEFLNDIGVRGVLTIRMRGQANAYKAGFSKVSDEKYKGIVTVDGNNKDSVEQTMEFVELLEKGYDFVQGSRFMKGGYHENTPLSRVLAIKLISNPLLSLSSGFKYTETMSAFRGFSMKIIDDERIAIFRDIFTSWESQWYLANIIPKLGYKVIEIPQTRVYPKSGKIPTKINFWGNIQIIVQLIKVVTGYYNVKK